jgi:hypothetical protein
MSTADKKDLYTELKTKVSAAYAALQEATDFADKHGLGFSWDVSYGMGGYYQGKGTEEDPSWDHSSCSEDDYGWRASSQSC